MDIILIAGLWLPQTIWKEVCADLERRGHRPMPVSLPGVDNGAATATLADQLNAALELVDAAERPLVVGHSAACTLAWMIADRRPRAIAGVVMIGGFPATDGTTYADYFATTDGAMPFPGWEPFEGPDAADLDATTRDRIATMAVAVPEGVAKGVVRLTDKRRADLPLVLVCPEYDSDQAQAWVSSGDVPELNGVAGISYIDIDTGHWPMVTQPTGLGRILDEIAEGLGNV